MPEHGSTALADVIIVAAGTLAACHGAIVCIVVVDAPAASDRDIRALDESLKVALGLLDQAI